MRFKNKKVVVSAAVVFGLIIIVFIDWRWNIGRGPKDIVSEYENSTYFQIVDEKDLKSKLSSPKDYHIVESDLQDNVKSRMQWDYKAKKIVEDLKIQDSFIENEAFAGGRKSPEKFEERILRLDARIEKYQRMLKKDPGNAELKEQLNNLMQMRAMVNNLEKAVVTYER